MADSLEQLVIAKRLDEACSALELLVADRSSAIFRPPPLESEEESKDSSRESDLCQVLQGTLALTRAVVERSCASRSPASAPASASSSSPSMVSVDRLVAFLCSLLPRLVDSIPHSCCWPRTLGGTSSSATGGIPGSPAPANASSVSSSGCWRGGLRLPGVILPHSPCSCPLTSSISTPTPKTMLGTVEHVHLLFLFLAQLGDMLVPLGLSLARREPASSKNVFLLTLRVYGLGVQGTKVVVSALGALPAPAPALAATMTTTTTTDNTSSLPSPSPPSSLDPQVLLLRRFIPPFSSLRLLLLTRVERVEVLQSASTLLPLVVATMSRSVGKVESAVKRGLFASASSAGSLGGAGEHVSSLRALVDCPLVRTFLSGYMRFLSPPDRASLTYMWPELVSLFSRLSALFSEQVAQAAEEIDALQIARAKEEEGHYVFGPSSTNVSPSASPGRSERALSLSEPDSDASLLLEAVTAVSSTLYAAFGAQFDEPLSRAYKSVELMQPGSHTVVARGCVHALEARKNATAAAVSTTSTAIPASPPPRLSQQMRDPNSVFSVLATEGCSESNPPSATLTAPADVSLTSFDDRGDADFSADPHRRHSSPMIAYAAHYRKHDFSFHTQMKSAALRGIGSVADRSAEPSSMSALDLSIRAIHNDMHRYCSSVVHLVREVLGDSVLALGSSSANRRPVSPSSKAAESVPFPAPLFSRGFQIVLVGSFARGGASPSGETELDVRVLLHESAEGADPATAPSAAERESSGIRALLELLSIRLDTLRALGTPVPALAASVLQSLAPGAASVQEIVHTSVGHATAVVAALRTIASIVPSKRVLDMLLAQQHVWSWNPARVAPNDHADLLLGEFNRLTWTKYLLHEKVHDGEAKYASVYTDPPAMAASGATSNASDANAAAQARMVWHPDLASEHSFFDPATAAAAMKVLPAAEERPMVSSFAEWNPRDMSTHRFAAQTVPAKLPQLLSPHQLLAVRYSFSGLHPLVAVRLQRMALYLLKHHFPAAGGPSSSANPLLPLSPDFASALRQLRRSSCRHVHLSEQLLNPLLLWITDFALFHGIHNPSAFENVEALFREKRISARFFLQVKTALASLLVARNAGLQCVDVGSVAIPSPPTLIDDCQCDDACSNDTTTQLMHELSPLLFPTPPSAGLPACSCRVSCHVHRLPCCIHLSLPPLLPSASPSSQLHAIHTFAWQLLIPLFHSSALLAQDAKAWGAPTQVHTSVTLEASLIEGFSNAIMSTSSSSTESQLLRDHFDPVASCLPDWVRTKAAFQTAQARSVAMQGEGGLDSAAPFATEILELQERVIGVVHQLAHDVAAAFLSPTRAAGMAPSWDARSSAAMSHFHLLVPELPTRFLFVHVFQSHVFHHLHQHATDSDDAGSDEPISQLLAFMASWPTHAGGRVSSVTEHLRAVSALHLVGSHTYTRSDRNWAAQHPGSTQIVCHSNWAELDSLLLPFRAPITLAPRESGLPAVVLSKRESSPFSLHTTNTKDDQLLASATFLFPTDETELPGQLSQMHKLLLHQYAANTLSDLLYGITARTFVVTQSNSKPSAAPGFATRLTFPSLPLLSSAAGVLLADMLADKSTLASTASSDAPHDLTAHNLRLLEMSLDPRCFSLKFIESLLFCPREENIQQLLAIPLTSNGIGTPDPAASGWRRHVPYALARSMIDWPFDPSQYECAHRAVGDMTSEYACPCTQQCFVFENAIESKRDGSLQLERVHIRSLVFCLDRIKDPLDLAAINEFLAMDSKQVLQAWLKDLSRIDGLHASHPVASKVPLPDDPEPEHVASTFSLPPLTVQHLFARWEHIASVLRQARDEHIAHIMADSSAEQIPGHDLLPHWHLLELVDPALFSFYDTHAWRHRIKDVPESLVAEEDELLEFDEQAARSLSSFSGLALARFAALPTEWTPVLLGYLHQCNAPAHFITARPWYAILQASDTSSSCSLQDLLQITLPTVASLFANLRTIVYRLRTSQSLFLPSKLQPFVYEALLNLTEWNKTLRDDNAISHHVKVNLPSRRRQLAVPDEEQRRARAPSAETDLTLEVLTFPTRRIAASVSLQFVREEEDSMYAHGDRYKANVHNFDFVKTRAVAMSRAAPPPKLQPQAPPQPIESSLWTSQSLGDLLNTIALRHVHLSGCLLLTDDLLDSMFTTSGAHLLSLDISMCSSIRAPAAALTALSAKCRNLQWLNLSSLDALDSVGASTLKSLFGQRPPDWPQLEYLYANQCTNLRKLAFIAPKLKGLSVRDCVQLETVSTGALGKAPSAAAGSDSSSGSDRGLLVQVDFRGCHALAPSPVCVAHADCFEANPTIARAVQAYDAKAALPASSHVILPPNALPSAVYSSFGAKTVDGWWMELDVSGFNPRLIPDASAAASASGGTPSQKSWTVGPYHRMRVFHANHVPSLATLTIDCPALEVLSVRDCPELKSLSVLNGIESGLKEVDLTSCHRIIGSLALVRKLLAQAPRIERIRIDEGYRGLEKVWRESQAEYDHLNGSAVDGAASSSSALAVRPPDVVRGLHQTLLRYGPHETFLSFARSPLRSIVETLRAGAVAEIKLSHTHPLPSSRSDLEVASSSGKTLGEILKSKATAQAKRALQSASNLERIMSGLAPGMVLDSSECGFESSPSMSGFIDEPASPRRRAPPLAAISLVVSASSSPSDGSSSSPASSNQEVLSSDRDDHMLLALSSALRQHGWMNLSLHSVSLTCRQCSSSCAVTHSVGLPALVSALLLVPHLATLELDGQGLGDKACASILAALGGYEAVFTSSPSAATPTGSATPAGSSKSARNSIKLAAARLTQRRQSASLSAFSFVSTPGARHLPLLESLSLRNQSLTVAFTALDGPLHAFLEVMAGSLARVDLGSNALKGDGLKGFGQVLTAVKPTSLREINVEFNGAELEPMIAFARDVDALQPTAANAGASSVRKDSKRASVSVPATPISRLSLGCSSVIEALVKRMLPLGVESWSSAVELSKAKLVKAQAREKEGSKGKSKEQIKTVSALVTKSHDELKSYFDRCSAFVHYGKTMTSTPPGSEDASTLRSSISYNFDPNAAAASSFSAPSGEPTLLLDSYPVGIITELTPDGGMLAGVSWERALLHRISEAFYLAFVHASELRIDEERSSPAMIRGNNTKASDSNSNSTSASSSLQSPTSSVGVSVSPPSLRSTTTVASSGSAPTDAVLMNFPPPNTGVEREDTEDELIAQWTSDAKP